MAPESTLRSRANRSLSRTIIIALGIQAISLVTANADRIFPGWLNEYDPLVDRSQFATDVAIDGRGNVAVTGYEIDASGSEVIYTAKYDGLHGNLLWSKTSRSLFGGSRGSAVAFDSEGNVIITGYSESLTQGRNYRTIKYAANDGAIVFNQSYNNDGTDGADEGVSVAVDTANNVIVTGKSADSDTGIDILTIKYSAAGTQLWTKRFNFFGNREDVPHGVAVDPTNNFVVVSGRVDGTSTAKFYTAKYNTNGDVGAAFTGTWEKTFLSEAQGATGLAVDSIGNVLVAGPAYISSGFTKDIKVIKYAASTGAVAWQDEIPTNAFNNWAGVAVDKAGSAYVAGTVNLDDDGDRIYLAKYDDDGVFQWQQLSPLQDGGDIATAVAVDPAGNAMVVGQSDSPNNDRQNEYYIARYLTDGTPRETISYNGNENGGTDAVSAVAADKLGRFAVTGNITKEALVSGGLFYNGIATIKFNRFLAVTGDPVTGPGLSAKAKLGKLFNPAIGNHGELVARVTVSDGKKKKIGAILTSDEDGIQQLAAVQSGDAPGIPGAKLKAFFDPVIQEEGKFAFIAKLSGNGAPKTAVYSNHASGTLTPVLQQGKELAASGNLAGLVLKSVSSISLRGTYLAALATVTGPGVDKKNNRVLLRVDSGGNAIALLRTGDPITVDGIESQIKTISALSNAKGSSGHGRSQSGIRTVARLSLKDGRSVIVSVTNFSGLVTQGPATDQDASSLVGGATWKSFGLPSGGGFGTAALLANVRGDGVSKNADSGIVYTTNFLAFSKVVAEGDSAPGVPEAANATFSGFADPVVSADRIAFVASLSGSGVNKKNKTSIWAGPLSPFEAPTLVARAGSPSMDTRGEPGTAKWTSFQSLALPGGNAAGPLFTAKLAGKKNNFGLWGTDSRGKLRQLIRTGDLLGVSKDDSLKGFTLLQASAGSAGATRSFNNNGGVGLLLKLKKGQAIYFLGIP